MIDPKTFEEYRHYYLADQKRLRRLAKVDPITAFEERKEMQEAFEPHPISYLGGPRQQPDVTRILGPIKQR